MDASVGAIVGDIDWMEFLRVQLCVVGKIRDSDGSVGFDVDV